MLRCRQYQRLKLESEFCRCGCYTYVHPHPSVTCLPVYSRLFPVAHSLSEAHLLTVSVFAVRVTVVGSVSVCVSIKSHLTHGVSFRPANTVTNSAGNRCQKICIGFLWNCSAMQRSSIASIKSHVELVIFLQKPCMHIIVFIMCGAKGQPATLLSAHLKWKLDF